jgi:transglutaminase-like putative cysteine protease
MAVNESYRFNADDNRRYTNFEITMVDDDLVSNDIMDIDGSSRTGRTLNVTYDIVNGSWRGNDIGGVADGSLDGTSSLDDDDGMVAFDLELAPIDENRTYRWSFLGSEYSMQATVPPRAYASYTSKDVPRSYYFGYTDAEVQRFVTSGDPVIASIAAQLRNMSASAGFDEVETIDLALRFCQSIQYSYDNATMDADEYWRFPVETLYDETGDCEDTSFLFASVAEAMGYDAVILFLPGHAAVGVASGDGSGTYVSEGGVRYYYCETTSPGFELGELPYGLEGEDVDVVQVS